MIVLLSVNGGKHGQVSLREYAKEAIRFVLPYLGIHKYTDHHVWHPTYKELTDLISECGFEIEKIVWQENQNNTVCCLQALKKMNLSRKVS